MINYGHTHEVYAAEELETGAVWLDGKPIYRRTVTFGAVAAGGAQTVSLGLGTELGTVVSLRGMAILADTNYVIPLPYSTPDVNYLYALQIVDANTAPKISVGAGVGAGAGIVSGFAVIEYTKK